MARWSCGEAVMCAGVASDRSDLRARLSSGPSAIGLRAAPTAVDRGGSADGAFARPIESPTPLDPAGRRWTNTCGGLAITSDGAVSATTAALDDLIRTPLREDGSPSGGAGVGVRRASPMFAGPP